MAIALATCSALPHLDADEVHLVRALDARGIPHVIAPWDGGDQPFVEAELTVIRSTWDYTKKVDDFVDWVARVEAAGRIFNPASVVRWNSHKRYLGMLAQEGIATVPTAYVTGGADVDVGAMLRERGWRQGAVVKPAVSAGSADTVRMRDDSDTASALALLAAMPGRDMMVQPFVEAIAEGELSLIFIDGTFSHAVNKRPRADDFRSQPEFGSTVTRVEPSRAERSAADDVLATVGGQLLYARVDFVRGDDGRPWLMELELIEPSLYLAHDDKAADKLAAAIEQRRSR